MSTAADQNGGVTTQFFGTGNTEETQPKEIVTTSDSGTETTFFSDEAKEDEPGKETSSEETSTEAKKEEEQADSKTDETKTDATEKKPTFKVNRTGTKTETETKTEEAKTETNKETYSVTDDSVINFLKTKGLDISSLDEVTKKTKLPDAVEEFKKFNEKTGGGIEAYYNANKDWAAQPKDSTLKEYIKYQNPGASDEDINTQLELLSVSEEEQDELSERELKQRKLDYSKEYNKALKFMQGVSNEYKIPKENQNTQQKPPTPEEIEAAHRPWREQRDKSLEKLNEISLPIEGLGDIKLPITEEQKSLIVNATQTQEAFFDRWKNKDGTLNSDKSSLDTAWGIQEVRDELIANMLSEAHTMFIENFSKDKRNVTLGKPKQEKTGESNGSMTVLGNSKSEGSTKMGTPLFVRQ
ncbi:hypothetical protein M1M25_gp054 [Tenacibaculum phage Gundel_1]|uniref:Uncharacterized protein n=1 Tax=Tenacibaculum phage Gundel_1 TaxID=2745672 RepID=A0A8E4ZK64_9CAUD|nr:hypothetical protein M1M25_gp054 [Tenacibaculum phage Gundel_1]QQV91488.1 hypothetical protein Gundel1_54 [Tenacibaculum phage Gundel_1]